MLGLVKDRDLLTGKPMYIVYRVIGPHHEDGYVILFDEQRSRVVYYIDNLKGYEEVAVIWIETNEILHLILRNDKEGLYELLNRHFDRYLV
jgi:hypothetical protein